MTSVEVVDIVTRSVRNGKANGRVTGRTGADVRYYIKFNEKDKNKWGLILREQSEKGYPIVTKIETSDLISLTRILLRA